MIEQYQYLLPVITAASIIPNPVSFNATITIALTVTEQIVILEPEPRYSGEYYAGEV